MSQLSQEWNKQPERGSFLLLRFMVSVSLILGRRATRILLLPITFYFFITGSSARHASADYLQTVRQRKPHWQEMFAHFFFFTSTVHDRIYFLKNRSELFDIRIEVPNLIDFTDKKILLVGAHFGSFELLKLMGHKILNRKITMMMNTENAKKINQIMSVIDPSYNEDVLSIGDVDVMLKAFERMEKGELIGMLADRVYSSDHAVVKPFLGKSIAISDGPFRMAAILGCSLYFMAGIYLGNNRYRLVIEPLTDFSSVAREYRSKEIESSISAYTQILEKHCRKSPLNWFNFYECWANSEKPITTN